MIKKAETIKEAFEVIREAREIYIPGDRTLIKYYSSGGYAIFNFETKERFDFQRQESDVVYFLYEKDYIQMVCNDLEVPGYKIFREPFTDKDMLEPVELGELKSLAQFKDKKISCTNLIKILRHKNVKALIIDRYTDDYTWDNATNYGKDQEADKFELMNNLKKFGAKAYRINYNREGLDQIEVSFYCSERIKVVLQ